MADAAKMSEGRHSAPEWAEYGSGDFGSEFSLIVNNRAPRMIVMKEAGDLLCRDMHGNVASLTGLCAWYEHRGQTSAILAGQTHEFIAYW